VNASTETSGNRALEVSPGLWQLRVQLPGHRLGWVNSYLLASEEGAIVIDTPWGSEEVLAEFLALIAATGTALTDIRIVLLTHYHDDHSGCAAYLRSQGAAVAIHGADTAAMRFRFEGSTYEGRLADWLGRVGADGDLSDYAFAQQESLRERFALPETDVRLEEGQIIELGQWRLRVVHTPGHTPGSVCFVDLDTRTLFSGDHVFPRRRSNAVHRPIGSERPLHEYWAGMERLVELDPLRVMPGHEHEFDQFSRRVSELARVRDLKLRELHDLVIGGAGDTTAFALAPRIRRSKEWAELDGNSRLAAVGETLAYLIELEHDGRLESAGNLPQHWKSRREASRA